MCTLAILWKCHAAAPLVIAQCRDEVLDRAALDVARWRTAGGVDVVSGRDVVAGGTWFGVGPRVVCGLTNRRDALGPRRGTRSRGELVVQALEQTSAADVETQWRALDGAAYGPFSILAVDDDALVYADNARDDVVIPQRLAPGVHVLGNFGIDNEDDPVVRTVGSAVRGLVDGAVSERALVSGLQEILARHGPGWPCVHLPEHNYGTRSAGVLVWRREDPRLSTTEAAPCSSPWRDSSRLLDAR